VKIYRLLLVVALFGISASAVLADGIDPLVGVKSGGGSTPITLTNPNPTVTATVGTTGCSIAGDTCVVDVFQNQTGSTLTALTIFIPTTTVGGNILNFTCNNAETAASGIFASCNAAAVAGGTDINFSGGPGVPTAVLTFVSDKDSDDSQCPSLGPGGLDGMCADDFKLLGGEFAVDIEGTITNGSDDLPVGTSITAQAITTPEPNSAFLLLFGMLAVGLTKATRRA